MSYRLAYQCLSGPVRGFIEFEDSLIRGGPVGPRFWNIVGKVEGEYPRPFRAEPVVYNFQRLEQLNGEFHAFVAGGTITITYVNDPGATIVGRADGNYEIRGRTHVIYFD